MEILYPCQGNIYHELIFIKIWGERRENSKKELLAWPFHRCYLAGMQGSGGKRLRFPRLPLEHRSEDQAWWLLPLLPYWGVSLGMLNSSIDPI